MNDLLLGFKYVLAGSKLLVKPGIRLYVIIPFMVNSLLFTAMIVYGTSQLSDLIDWLTGQWAWVEWVSWLLWPIFFVTSLTVVFFCFTILANLIAAPFNGFLAEAVENYLIAEKVENSGKLSDLPGEFVNALKVEIRKFLYFVIRAIPLLVLFVIPFIQVIAPIVWFLFGAWMLTLQYMDYPMGNNGMFFQDIHKSLKTKRSLSLGFGFGIMVVTILPVINFIAMPVAVAGATLLWTEKIKEPLQN